MRTRLLNMTWSNLRFNVWRSFVTMATNVPSCFSIQFLEQLLKFLVNFTLLKYVKSQRNYGFLITKELIFGFQILDLNYHFSASLKILGFLLVKDCRLEVMAMNLIVTLNNCLNFVRLTTVQCSSGYERGQTSIYKTRIYKMRF